MVFAIVLLEPIAQLLYFAFVSVLTMAVLVLKFYLYSVREEESSEGRLFEGEEEVRKRRLRWSFIIVLCLIIAALFSPLILLALLEPLWTFIIISGFIPAVSIPEIILYTYSQRSKGRK
jgi:carbon starvation protein CstA